MNPKIKNNQEKEIPFEEFINRRVEDKQIVDFCQKIIEDMQRFRSFLEDLKNLIEQELKSVDLQYIFKYIKKI